MKVRTKNIIVKIAWSVVIILWVSVAYSAYYDPQMTGQIIRSVAIFSVLIIFGVRNLLTTNETGYIATTKSKRSFRITKESSKEFYEIVLSLPIPLRFFGFFLVMGFLGTFIGFVLGLGS